MQCVFQLILNVFGGVKITALCRSLKLILAPTLNTPCVHGTGFVHGHVVVGLLSSSEGKL